MNTYTISELSQKLDTTVHSLRYWEKELALEINRDNMGYRFYTEEDIKLFSKIIELKEAGYKIKAIKAYLEEKNDATPMVKNEAPVEYDSDKLKQFASFLKIILDDSLKENQEVLRANIRKDMANEIEKSRQYSEAIEEKNFKKLDMTLREMQKSRQEAALAKNNKNLFRFFKNKNKP